MAISVIISHLLTKDIPLFESTAASGVARGSGFGKEVLSYDPRCALEAQRPSECDGRAFVRDVGSSHSEI
jgi:hypothetical protein